MRFSESFGLENLLVNMLEFPSAIRNMSAKKAAVTSKGTEMCHGGTSMGIFCLRKNPSLSAQLQQTGQKSEVGEPRAKLRVLAR
jgi:hypothetical protein